MSVYSETGYPARDESGHAIGTLYVQLTDDGAAPPVARDKFGTTWVFSDVDRRGFYQRVTCAQARLEVRK